MKETAKQKKMIREVQILSSAEGCLDAFLGAVSFCVVRTLASLIILQCHWVAFLWSPQALSPRFVLYMWGLPDPRLVCLSSFHALWIFLLTLSNTIIHRLMIFKPILSTLFSFELHINISPMLLLYTHIKFCGLKSEISTSFPGHIRTPSCLEALLKLLSLPCPEMEILESALAPFFPIFNTSASVVNCFSECSSSLACLV